MVILTEAEVEVFKIDDDEEGEQCGICGSSVMWEECTNNCDYGEIEEEGDDYSDDMVSRRCETCGGAGGWWQCLSSWEYHTRIGIERGKVTA